MKSQKANKKRSLGIAIGFALVLLITSPQTALAQQWTTNGNNISNTNSGNVGIGTTNPQAQLHVLQALRIDGTDVGGYRAIGFGGISNTTNPNIYTKYSDKFRVSYD